LRDTEVVVGHQIALLPQFSYPPGSVLWKGQNIACPECVATMALPVQSGEYSVMAYSANGCAANAAFQVTVDEAFGLYIPNVFSPNDDGVNDDWGIAFDGASVAGIEQVTILDRWGGVIFFQQHPPLENAVKLWDGTRNSTRAPAGVYTYALIVNVINGERLYKTGSVTLVR
jgi:gliding motility-associated-like protein